MMYQVDHGSQLFNLGVALKGFWKYKVPNQLTLNKEKYLVALRRPQKQD